MSDFLVDQAIADVWCDPSQDFQHLVKPQRMCNPAGISGTFNLLEGSYSLPTTTGVYYVYAFGLFPPYLMGIFKNITGWTSLASMASQYNLFSQVYSLYGLNLSLSQSYIGWFEGALYLAVKDQPNIISQYTNPIYVRFYSNAYFVSARQRADVKAISVQTYVHTTTAAGLTFQALYHGYQAKSGYVWLYVNGVYVNDFIPMNLTVGDIVEFVYDSTVKMVVDFPIANLNSFISIKDNLSKYLLHYTQTQVGGPVIDYRDDIDVHLILPGSTTGAFAGYYFQRNQDNSFDQVTHRDYSIALEYLTAYLENYSAWTNLASLTIRLAIRYAGYARPLVYEANRIQELYKLPEPDLANAMMGIDANVDVWKAANLENSPYVQLMGSTLSQITRDLAEDAYGYNAISKMLADAPEAVDLATNSYVGLPEGLQNNSTIYEYDSNGLLLGWYPHPSGNQYVPTNQSLAWIEGRVGIGTSGFDQVMNQPQVTLDPTLSYRFYIAPVNNGVVDNTKWQDVTGDTSKYQIANNVLMWSVSASSWQTCVKSDLDILTASYTLAPLNGLLQFTITSTNTYPSGSVKEILYIPPGTLDLWINGASLIENVDYYVNWPTVVIINKRFLSSGTSQALDLRATGFCNSDMSRPVPEEAAYLRWGALSHNDRFNLRDDRVIRIVADGRMLDRSQVVFSEDNSQATIPIVPNGSPYSVTNVVVPLRGFTNEDTYTMLAVSQATDKAVSDYLTMKIPDQTPTSADIIPSRYPVYSPFTSTIIHDMLNGILSMDPFMGNYSTMDVRNRLKGYEYLLEYDPIINKINLDYVMVEPHNLTTMVELSIYQYKFIERAIEIYLNGDVTLVGYVRMTGDYQ